MRELSFLFVLLAAGGLAGCARFQPMPVSAERSAAEFQGRELSEPGLKRFLEENLHTNLVVWPPSSWDFATLTLAAFYYQPDLDLARAKWAVSRAGKVTAGERPNPTLGVVPAYSSSVSVPSPWLVTPTLDIPIETAGKRGYRITQADHLSEAARLNIASTAWQVRSNVRRSLLSLYAAGETKALLEQQQTVQAENISLLERQYTVGAISAFELTQARLASDNARLALRDAEAQSADARIQLADAIGVPSSALEGIRFSFESFGRAPDDVLSVQARRQALLNRSDVLGAVAEYAASQSALQLEIAKQYPDLHLGPGYEYDQGNNKWSIGLSVTLPVLSQNKGPIAEAEAHRIEAAASFNALQARVVAEIERAFAAYQAAVQKRADAAALLAHSRKQEKTSQAMLDAGEISKAELAALRLQLSANELACVDALAKSQSALGQLEDSLQSPLGFEASAWQLSPRIAAPKTSRQQP